ncbi:hypothetical protein [Corallococcus interemptor]|uniref:hypothetical protein n=1 Tax=Corallococcus interemptor TaxID=2316720 RepID=UPI0011C42CCB|nr:hypothetical protein [Corallococcus interemptor]
MTTKSDNNPPNEALDISDEPIGLSATAAESPPSSKHRQPPPPSHQQAIELLRSARNERNKKESKQLLRKAAELEQRTLREVQQEPEHSLIAEMGANAALNGGDFQLAAELAHSGLRATTPQHLQWNLIKSTIQADILSHLQLLEREWPLAWKTDDKDDSLALTITPDSRRKITVCLSPDHERTEIKQDKANITITLPVEPISEKTLSGIIDAIESWESLTQKPKPIWWERKLAGRPFMEPFYA